MEKRCHSRMMLGQFWLSVRTSFVAVTKPFRPYRAFYVRLVAIAFEHQGGNPPNVDLGDHAGERYCSKLY